MPHPNIQTSVVRQLRLSRQVSRVDLARQLSVAPSTIGIHVDRLVDDGFLREGRRIATGSGRPPTVIELNPEAGQFIGIDLDARTIYGASVDFAQRLLRDRATNIRATDSATSVLESIAQVIDEVRDRHRELLGIGIAVPGTIDAERGIGIHYEYIRGWHDLDLVSMFRERFDTNIAIENNVRTMALAERWFGQTRETPNSICIGIRTGIGSGVILDGELMRGANGLAGEIGGWPVDTSSGDVKTLESVSSLRAILGRAEVALRDGRHSALKLKRNRVDSASFIQAANSGDELCSQLLNDAASSLGRAIAQMCLLLNPEQVVLCGPLATLGEEFVGPTRKAVEIDLPAFRSRAPVITSSDLGDLAGALGAAALSAQAWTIDTSG